MEKTREKNGSSRESDSFCSFSCSVIIDLSHLQKTRETLSALNQRQIYNDGGSPAHSTAQSQQTNVVKSKTKEEIMSKTKMT